MIFSEDLAKNVLSHSHLNVTKIIPCFESLCAFKYFSDLNIFAQVSHLNVGITACETFDLPLLTLFDFIGFLVSVDVTLDCDASVTGTVEDEAASDVTVASTV